MSRERKIINLNSNNASIFYNSTFLSNLLFSFSGILKDTDDISFVEGGILNAEIPVSFYAINYTDNVLTYTIQNGVIFTDYVITIDVGNYDSNTFFIELQQKFLLNGHNFTITINSSNGKITMIYIPNATENFYGIKAIGSTMLKVLGFDNQDYLASLNVLIAPYLLNLLGIKKLKIYSSVFACDNKDSVGYSTSDLIGTIPCDAPPYGMILYNNFENIYGRLRINRIDTIDIQILDENSNFINFNNTDWTLTLVLNIYYKQKKLISFSKNQQEINSIEPNIESNIEPNLEEPLSQNQNELNLLMS